MIDETAYNLGVTTEAVATILDNDPTPSLSINNLNLPEGNSGTTAFSFTVTLSAASSQTVTVDYATSDGTALAPDDYTAITTTTLTFAPDDLTKTVTVLVNGDLVAEADETFTVDLSSATNATIDTVTGTGTITNDDSAGITVSPTSGLVTTESGGTASFTVVLNTQPSADVSIALSSSDPTEGTVSPTPLTFTSADWNTAQTVTVTGVDDAVVDGNVGYTVSFAVSSSDGSYNNFSVPPVSVTNDDNDTAGITVSPTSGLVTTESGGTATFTVVLTTQPSADVTLALSSSDTTEGTVSPTPLTFTSADWNIAQTVTVTGVDDAVIDGNIAYTVNFAVSSGDGSYNNFSVPPVSVTNDDNDTAGITVSPTSGLVTTESGGTASFTVVLTTQPSADVSIALSSSDPTEGAVGPTPLTFTSADWNTAQTVTVTGVDDAVVDGNVGYTVSFAVSSSDGSYNNFSVPPVSVTNNDNDSAGITVSPTSGLVTTESGGTATFTVVLTTQPSADVTLALSSSDTTEGTVSAPPLTFTSADWNTPQTVTVTGVDDAVIDGNIAYTVNFAVSSGDGSYNNSPSRRSA